MKWLVKIVCNLVVLTALLMVGCRQRDEQLVVLAVGPGVDDIVPSNTYAPKAIEATGGYPAWINTKKFEFDSIVTFYNPDNTFYLTEQHYEIFPWSNAVRVSASEPQGDLVWLLHTETFTLESTPPSKPLPYDIQDTIYAVRDIILAPIHLLDRSADFTKNPRPTKIDGLWYYPIEQTGNIPNPAWTRKVFYQNKADRIVDRLWFADFEKNTFLAVRGYDYRETEKNGVYFPARVEIFKTDSDGILRQRLGKLALNYR